MSIYLWIHFNIFEDQRQYLCGYMSISLWILVKIPVDQCWYLFWPVNWQENAKIWWKQKYHTPSPYHRVMYLRLLPCLLSFHLQLTDTLLSSCNLILFWFRNKLIIFFKQEMYWVTWKKMLEISLEFSMNINEVSQILLIKDFHQILTFSNDYITKEVGCQAASQAVTYETLRPQGRGVC